MCFLRATADNPDTSPWEHRAGQVRLLRIKSNLEISEVDTEDLKLLDGFAEELKKTGKVQRFVYRPFGIDFGFQTSLDWRIVCYDA